MTQLRQVRHNYNLAVEDGRHDDAQELQEREYELERQLERLRNTWDRSTARWLFQKTSRKWCRCGPACP
jgi:hypothetical protein